VKGSKHVRVKRDSGDGERSGLRGGPRLRGALLRILVVLVWLPFVSVEAQFRDESDSVLVVYNERMPESREVAEHYAAKRGVPKGNLLGLRMARLETVSRREFQDQLEGPLLDHLTGTGAFRFEKLDPSHGLAKGREGLERLVDAKIRYVVLCLGTPLRIRKDASLKEERALGLDPLFQRNEAAIDSELAALPLKRTQPMLAGLARNPGFLATNSFRVHPTNGVLMVTRLDGPSKAVAMGLVDKAMEAEETGLWGRAYFDARGITEGGYKSGDEMILKSANGSRVAGFECEVDNQGPVFGPGAWLSDVAIYMGWYETHVTGPFASGHASFAPGAIAYHLHSFSAATVRNPKQHWVGPLLDQGATATFGYVYEPYLGGTVNLPKFLERIVTRRFNYGEAAYSSINSLSWMATFVGDPLYRPFKRDPNELHGHLVETKNERAAWSVLRFVNLQLAFGAEKGKIIEFLKSQPLTAKSPVLQEKLGDLLWEEDKVAESGEAFGKALELHPSGLQKGRLLETLARRMSEGDKPDESRRAYRRLIEDFPNHPSAGDWRNRADSL